MEAKPTTAPPPSTLPRKGPALRPPRKPEEFDLHEPKPLDFVLPGLPRGKVGLMAAPGGVGKSWLMWELAAQVSAGLNLLGLQALPTGKVLLVAAEDEADVLALRQRVLKQRMNETQRQQFNELVAFHAAEDIRYDLMEDETLKCLLEYGRGCRLIILDPLSILHSGEENDRGDAVRLMNNLRRLAQATGAAIVFVHHTNKAASLSGEGHRQQAARGSSAFVDHARWMAYLQMATPEDAKRLGLDEDQHANLVRLGFGKLNYCAALPPRWLWRESSGLLVEFKPEPGNGLFEPALRGRGGLRGWH